MYRWNIILKYIFENILYHIENFLLCVNGFNRNDLPITICFAFLHTDEIYDKQNKTISVQ